MKTFNDFYGYIRTLTPMSETNTPYSAHPVDGTNLGIAIYDVYTQANIINMDTGISIVNIFFRPETGDAECFKVDPIKGCAIYSDPCIIVMNQPVDIYVGYISSKIGVDAGRAIKEVFDAIESPMSKEDRTWLMCISDTMAPNTVDLLMGRLLKVRQDCKTKNVSFIDAETNEYLCGTTPATLTEDVFNNKTFLTVQSQKSKYQLVGFTSDLYASIKKLAASAAESFVWEQPSMVELTLTLPLESDVTMKSSHATTEFTFNKDMTKEEFIEFLQQHGYHVRTKFAQHGDRSEIEGSGKVWTYTWVSTHDE